MPRFPKDRENSRAVRFVPHPLFSHSDALAQIEQLKPEVFEDHVSCRPPEGLPLESSSLGKLCEQPVLTRGEERYLFLRMNYEKFAAQSSQGKNRAEHLAQATALRNRILLSNIRLLVSLAGQFASRAVRTEDLVSEGVVPLLGAIELFDVSRGWAFGTYATHVLKNHFRRVGERGQKHRRRAGPLSETLLAEVPDNGIPEKHQESLAQRQDHLAEECLAQLPPVDQTILRVRFGFDGLASRLRSYAEVGEVVGLSKERVRVRAHRAIEQLRETAQERHWELPELETLNLGA